VADYTLFREEIAQSPVLVPVGPELAFILPISEFIAAIFLLIPQYRLKGLILTLTLMLLFTAYIISISSYSTPIPCACGGAIEYLSLKQHLVLNAILIMISAIGIQLQMQYVKEKKISHI
jgi:uncharacterized membrane protein YphA (DoxX/SURF4 family)